MSEFFELLESDAKRQISEESFDLDLSGYNDEIEGRWLIRPLTADGADKVNNAAANGGVYRAMATYIVQRAYRPEGGGRVFRPSEAEKLMKNRKFLVWVGEEIGFQDDFGWMRDMWSDREKKHSTTTRGSGE